MGKRKNLDQLALETSELLRLSRAPNTIKAYQADWADFDSWCSVQNRVAFEADAELIALYLTDKSKELKRSSLRRRLAAINVVFGLKGVPSPGKDPLVQDLIKGISRKSKDRIDKKRALGVDQLLEMVDALPDNLRGNRDKAILLLGFSGALRRSEISGLEVEDVSFSKEGLVCTIRNSKTDQSAEGERVAIVRSKKERSCPVRALEFWIEFSGIRSGPLFRGILPNGKLRDNPISGRTVAQIVQRAAGRVGIDPNSVAGHSLRSGLATEAARKGVGERIIQKQTRHKSLEVLRGYIQDGELFKDNASGELGL